MTYCSNPVKTYCSNPVNGCGYRPNSSGSCKYPSTCIATNKSLSSASNHIAFNIPKQHSWPDYDKFKQTVQAGEEKPYTAKLNPTTGHVDFYEKKTVPLLHSISSVKVGYCTYKVVFRADHEIHKKNRAEVNYKTGEISIDTNYPLHEQANCLIHEMVHALYANYYIEKGDNEERVTSVTANGLCEIMKHNPGLFQILEESLK